MVRNVILICLTLWSSQVLAHEGHESQTKQTAVQTHTGKGVINSIDATKGMVNISHDPIKSLDWPSMTMDFKVTDKAMLSKLKPGQKVTFELVEKTKENYQISAFK